MKTQLFSLNISDTQKIDLLLNKVNSVGQIVNNRHKYTIRYPNFKIKKYNQRKIWTDGMIQVYDCVNNTYNQFDHELAKKVSITIYLYKRSFAGKLGIYYLGSRIIKLNIGWEKYYKTSETFSLQKSCPLAFQDLLEKQFKYTWF